MHVHIVMWKLKESAEGSSREENAAVMKERLESLKGIIPQLIHAEVGIDLNHIQSNYDAVLITRFNSEEDLDTYKVHPDHVAIGEFISKVSESRVAVDYWE